MTAMPCVRSSPPTPGSPYEPSVVWLEGEHDLSTAEALAEELARVISRDEADLVMDLSGVEFMAAATVELIVRARKFLAPASRSLILRAPSSSARRVLDLLGLEYSPAPELSRSA